MHSPNLCRLATAPGKAGQRPTVVVAADWKVWLGNERPEPLTMQAFPIFGFGLGEFEDKVVAGRWFVKQLIDQLHTS